MPRHFPYEIRDVDAKTNQELLQDFTGERTGFVQVGPQKWFLPSKYRQFAAHNYNLKVRPDDVWIIGMPRSGITLTQEICWLIENNLDYETAAKIPLASRVTDFAFIQMCHDDVIQQLKEKNAHIPETMQVIEGFSKSWMDTLDTTTSRRFLKAHLPISLLPPDLLTAGCKVIYIARNPKDVAVSYYHLSRRLIFINYKRDFPKYWKYFQNGQVFFSPYWSHVLEGWNLRNNPNLLFLFYEDTVKDMAGTIKRVAKFLGKNMTSEQVHILANHMHFDNFKMNKSVGTISMGFAGNEGEQPFIRKGKTGSWMEEFSPEILEMADIWIEENLKKTDLRFPE